MKNKDKNNLFKNHEDFQHDSLKKTCCDPCCDPCPKPCPGPHPGPLPEPCCDLSKIKIECTPAYELYFKENIDYSDYADITEAFNINNGNPPYTVISAEFTGIQQAIYDLQILPLGNGEYQFKGLIKPYLIIDYKDNSGITKNKFLSIDIIIDHIAYIGDSVNDIDVYSILKSGNVYDLSYASDSNTLSLRYELQTELYAIKNEPEKFAVLSKNKNCKEIETEEISILKLNTACYANTSVIASDTVVPFNRIENGSYQILDFKFLPVKPNLINIQKNANNVALNISFPVEFTLLFGTVESKQESALFVTIIMNNYNYITNSQFLLSLSAELLQNPRAFENIIQAPIIIEGIVNNVNPDIKEIQTVDFVDCGFVSLCNCDISIMYRPTVR